MNLFNRWLDKIDNFLAYISAATIFLMMIWVFADVMMRYFFHSPIPGTMEITGEYLLPIIAFFAISYTQKQNGHVNVDLLYGKFSKSVKRIVSFFTNIISLSLFIVLGINNFQEGLKYFERNIRSVGLLDYPLAPALMIITLGILILSIRLVFDTLKILRNTKEFE